jgi:hypothetical protein
LQHFTVTRIRGSFELLQHMLADNSRLCVWRWRAIWAGVSGGLAGLGVFPASACCSSTDLLSHPRATEELYLPESMQNAGLSRFWTPHGEHTPSLISRIRHEKCQAGTKRAITENKIACQWRN